MTKTNRRYRPGRQYAPGGFLNFGMDKDDRQNFGNVAGVAGAMGSGIIDAAAYRNDLGNMSTGAMTASSALKGAAAGAALGPAGAIVGGVLGAGMGLLQGSRLRRDERGIRSAQRRETLTGQNNYSAALIGANPELTGGVRGASMFRNGGNMQTHSIVDYLDSIGQDSSQAARKKLAEQHGLQGYNYSAEQNLQLLGMLRSGQPPAAPPATTLPRPPAKPVAAAKPFIQPALDKMGDAVSTLLSRPQGAPKKQAAPAPPPVPLQMEKPSLAPAVNSTAVQRPPILSRPAATSGQDALEQLNDGVTMVKNWWDRQQSKKDETLHEAASTIRRPDYNPTVVTGDTIPDGKRQYHLPEVLDLNNMRFGTRNRGDRKPLETPGGVVTTFNKFTPASQYFRASKDPDNATYIGIDRQGRLKTGGRKDFGDDDQVTRTFSNKVVDFNRDANGATRLVNADPKASKTMLSPSIRVLGDDGKTTTDGRLSLLVPKNKDTRSFGSVTGGRYIFKTPDGEQKLVSGSLEDLQKQFYQMKGKHPYLEVITLDNGSYSRGLRTRDGKLSAEDQKSYDLQNASGGNFAYIQPSNYSDSKQQYKEYYTPTPNVRTRNDASYKAGHSDINEDKAIVLHHTGSTDPKTADADVRSIFMKPGGNSAHVVIGFDGTRTRYANPDQVAFHAGVSKFKGRDNVNDFSVGVEFQGDTNKKPLTDRQINSFVEYALPLIRAKKMSLDDITTHHIIAGERKPDINDRDYQRIRAVLKSKGVYATGGELKRPATAASYDPQQYASFGDKGPLAFNQGWTPHIAAAGSTTYLNRYGLLNKVVIPGDSRPGSVGLITRGNRFDVTAMDADGKPFGEKLVSGGSYEDVDKYLSSTGNVIAQRSNQILSRPEAGTTAMKFAGGGAINAPLTEAVTEGGTSTPLSSDSVEFKGPSHAAGGIQLPQVGAEVEGGETAKGSFVFSKELGFAKLHRPLAKAIGKIELKPATPDRKTALSLLRAREGRLAQAQETYKQVHGIQ
jgi:N-acetyl-anhydromuramyl-L-alanine amidase AmpD